MKSILKLTTIIILMLAISCTTKSKEKKILVFTKTAGFKHKSIPAGAAAILKMGAENGFLVDTTDNANWFTEEKLKTYATVVFLNTTGDVLNQSQQSNFERYIQAGGGYVGIHAATDTEYDWPWYGKLAGAYFENHPKIQEATLTIVDHKHLSTQHLDSTWIKTDEWYNFKNINPDINVLIKVDENSYKGGKNRENHPISWYHDFDGGKAFYTELGHTDETYKNPKFIDHLLGGINYTIGDNVLDYGKATTEKIPEENRFVKTVLDFNLDEPMELDELPGKGILFIERRGTLKLFDFKENKTKEIAKLDVFYGNEDGLLGLAVDPNYEKNNWIYLFYSKPGDEPLQHISRFDLVDNKLLLESEKLLLEIPVIRKCCHSGGALEFGPKGNLFITIGDNTNPFQSDGYAPIDEREGRALWDAQKSASNTNDLRGKILRIKPEDNGTYSIPKGNLFPEGTDKTRPEIYIMGNRNPFRLSIDSKTGFVYWGDIGPDAGKDNPNRGPKGMGEFDQAREAGYYGWPYTRGNNQPYNDFDFTTNTSGPKFDPNNIINNSPNNTGLQKLPPVKESQIWFSYDASEEFPWLGIGGVNPMSGPVFHKDDSPNAKETFPEYFENKLFVYEWMRDWIYVVTLDNNYDYVKADAFMPNSEFSHPMDMIFGSDGNMYVLEYGQSWNSRNMDARLDRIEYIKGNRKPIATIKNDHTIGGEPLTINFKGDLSEDYDNDELTYEWSYNGEVQSTEINPTLTFDKIGSYTVELKVTDKLGESATASQKILVGNDIPEITITTDESNPFYWKGKTVAYEISVTDKQDGTTINNGIDQKDVKVSLNYIPQGRDMVKATIGHQQIIDPEGKTIIDNADCKACHAIDKKVNGPSYKDIANKYSKKDIGYLINKIINGGSGVWGETMMVAHPTLSTSDANKIVDYVISLKLESDNTKLLPLKGTLVFNEHDTNDKNGAYILTASYTDKGKEGLESAELTGRKQLIFKPPYLRAQKANKKSEGLNNWKAKGYSLVGSIKDKSFLKFNKIDLNGLKSIDFTAYFGENYNYKGILEIRIGSKTGKIIGTTKLDYFNKDKGELKVSNIKITPTNEVTDLFLVFKNEADTKQFICNANAMQLNY
ncbi:ThuA domain-containing protein [Aureibaculum sp. A20]|uniref:ThuA domain-containing protein n=1 Tax=Aureibaculum flavum TaxID=2795986 RepID=A0ABS0WNE8_9FLAO|nr:ThuA domain-containing protein [Aureibaculum flavum]MBJ2173484.1 ThuA domain-containing protein [Aureibaculum flavum]